ncbi:DUF7692 domain-containing protein [Natronolimnohabitans innermongolicus]|uniref:DUF7692 domain-containing protein n=1 Tax=Natronolimnohabitans innermongolicus JCM 12255 TaxID=1227499 RepID=L9WE00_9EURY|nr:hypothetical protein [Natronolimnohabitans innermongolicus]ELY47735.1 hypothetical protein C493_22206 [Natronolimnohabitans innermongolicus JCM 12255]
MSQSNDIPGRIRIRTDDGNEWRYDEIQRAADWYDCNRSNAAAFACHDVTRMVAAAKRVLERDDLTRKQRREIASTLSTGNVRFDVDLDVSAEKQRD